MAENDPSQNTTSGAQQPGQVIVPGQSPSPTPSTAAPQTAPAEAPAAAASAPVSSPASSPAGATPNVQPSALPTSAPPSPPPSPVSSASPSPPTPPSSSPFAQQSRTAQQAGPQSAVPATGANGDGISWTASEFVGHEKTFGWYVALAAAAVVVAIVIYMLTKDKISTAVVLLGALSLGVLAGRQPGPQTYQLDENGVTIGNRHYAYTMFKAFSVNPEGGISSVVFTPLKRFAPLTTIYYAPEDEEKILDQLSSQLPFEHRKPDAVDSMMRRIRF